MRPVALVFGTAVWAAAAGLPFAAVAQTQLTLGYYVQADSTCAQASNASITLVHWSGKNVSRVACDYVSVTPVGPNLYNYTESCTEISQGDTFTSSGQILISGARSFTVQSEHGTFSYRYCAQAEMPEPWRSNDISDFRN